ncbi:hypothetical protein B1R32_1344 [Abditibacterium utsteinense]|uniref:Uncharacterized protein n=1 Tax=Abditibacterium utsteinense TaxID=1960156 RepID=A0A2S8SNT2_9BACT|nr:hypothetical protein B1R32_1344 [Abditibacterium utsteinense]
MFWLGQNILFLQYEKQDVGIAKKNYSCPSISSFLSLNPNRVGQPKQSDYAKVK